MQRSGSPLGKHRRCSWSCPRGGRAAFPLLHNVDGVLHGRLLLDRSFRHLDDGVRDEIRRFGCLLRILRELLRSGGNGLRAALRALEDGGQPLDHVVERLCHAPDLIVRINGEVGECKVAARDLLCSIADANERFRCHRGEEIGKDACRHNKDETEHDDGQCRMNAQGCHIVMRRLRDDDPTRRRILRIAHIVLAAVNIDVDDTGVAC